MKGRKLGMHNTTRGGRPGYTESATAKVYALAGDTGRRGAGLAFMA